MKNFIFSKPAKIIVDIILFLGILVLALLTDKASMYQTEDDKMWRSVHCLSSIIWFLITIIHVIQHWKLIRLFTKKKVILKNKITASTILVFLMMTVSIIFFIFVVNDFSKAFHNIAGHLYMLIVIIHIIHKSKRFISFLKPVTRISSDRHSNK